MKSWALLIMTVWLVGAVVAQSSQDLTDDENEIFEAEDAAAAAVADSSADDISNEEDEVDEQMSGNIRVARAAQQQPAKQDGERKNKDRGNNGQGGGNRNRNMEKNGKNNKDKACRYQKGPWSECDTATNQRTRSLTLKKAGDGTCEKSKTITKKCKKAGAGSGAGNAERRRNRN